MSHVTFQIISGMEQGRIIQLTPPASIGREEDNHLRLNDDRVSRCHAKVQEDSGRIILMDIGSTNGTRVNGLPVQMRVLQIGDQIAVGRTVLVYGSPEEIAERLRERDDQDSKFDLPTMRGDRPEFESASSALDGSPDFFPNGPPELPTPLRPIQSAQLSDVLAFIHSRLELVIDEATEINDEQKTGMSVSFAAWQHLLRVQMTLATYLQRLSEPTDPQ
jgi:pSer/pThr/pTyr-binding forkhead associated (FHA) protein